MVRGLVWDNSRLSHTLPMRCQTVVRERKASLPAHRALNICCAWPFKESQSLHYLAFQLFQKKSKTRTLKRRIGQTHSGKVPSELGGTKSLGKWCTSAEGQMCTPEMQNSVLRSFTQWEIINTRELSRVKWSWRSLLVPCTSQLTHFKT